MNLIKITSALAFVFLFQFSASAQFIYSSKCEEFNNTDTLYLIKNDYTDKKYQTKNGEEIIFSSLCKKIWSEKVIVEITRDAYRKLPKVNNKYYLVYSLVVTGINGEYTFSAIFISQGQLSKDETYQKEYSGVGAIVVDLHLFEEGYLPERLPYLAQTLHDQIVNYKKHDFRGHFSYKDSNYVNILSSKTLYFREDLVNDEFKKDEVMKQYYPYPYKIVSKEEWERAITEKDSKVVVADMFTEVVIGSLHHGYYLWDTSNGQLVGYAFPFYSTPKYNVYKVEKNFFYKLLGKN